MAWTDPDDDTIRDPKLVDEAELLLYDRVIANPPFSLDEWGRDVAALDDCRATIGVFRAVRRLLGGSISLAPLAQTTTTRRPRRSRTTRT